MITIYKGDRTAVVSRGSFKRMFQPYGWSEKKPKVQEKSKPPQEPPKEPPKEPEGEVSKLESMTEKELRQYAALIGVKTQGLKTREELMEAIAEKEE